MVEGSPAHMSLRAKMGAAWAHVEQCLAAGERVQNVILECGRGPLESTGRCRRHGAGVEGFQF